MKLHVTLRITLMTVAALGLLFALSACSTEITEEVVPQANLLSLTVTTAPKTGAERTREIPVIPVPIPHTDWNNEEYQVVAADFGTIVALKDEDIEEIRLNPTVSPGARVTWGKARDGNRPPSFTDPRVSASFTYNDFVYLKVTADDGITSNYYRFYAIPASPVRELTGMSISGRDAEKVPQAAASDDPTAAFNTLKTSVRADNTNFYARVAITVGEAAAAVVNAEPAQEDATFRYAVAADYLSAEQPGAWQDSNVMTFTDGNILYVEVTAQNEEAKSYYAFWVTAGRIATIATLHLDGVEVVGKGTPHRQMGSIMPGAFSSADQTAAGFEPTIVLTDPESVYDYQVVATTPSSPPSSGWRRTGLTRIENGEQLIIRVRPAVAPTTNTDDMKFYRVITTLLAANVTQQPKSAVYTVTDHPFAVGTRVTISATPDPAEITLDKEIAQLSVALDRSGNFTYQWYTANSWYGGYGFDRDGRITTDAGTVIDTYHPNPGSLDEKGNVSLHNGGNQYYRLPNPGNLIPGATQATYTPSITRNNRPFLSGFSNQTQYYYVVITNQDSGYKVTSQRAAIVTEWNQTWNVGRPQGEKFAEPKKHYIVDLYAFTDNPQRGEGLQGPPRNPTPFIDGNHRDKYLIPMALPQGFNIMDYSIVTAQAKFYLADGREWIQNWTQGDFGFSQVNGEQVLWYNLTNDNATRALSNSGNDPVGSGLTSNPTELEIRPAGTKPLKQMPPFQDGQGGRPGPTYDSEGRLLPQNNNDAQGWFTPYIEIVELRFEGPARE